MKKNLLNSFFQDISRFQPVQLSDESKNGGSKAPKSTFYFYQSSDGEDWFI